jgi:hypothetical protein
MKICGLTTTYSASIFVCSLGVTGCSVSIDSTQMTQACLERISADALQTPQSWPIGANLAGRIGFGPPRGLDAPPIQTKQVGFLSPDGSQHSIAFEGAAWTRALLIRVVNDGGQPRTRLYAIDRQSTLVGAAEGRNGEVEVLRPEEPRVREDYQSELQLWRSAGPDEACGRG